MPVDESQLAEKITSLRVLVSNGQERLEKAAHALGTLESIMDADSVDPVINEAMTAARRQQIYDACMPVAEEMIRREAAYEDLPESE